MELLHSPDAWVAFLTLLVLEVVLGVDNVIFTSILSGELPGGAARPPPDHRPCRWR